MNITDEQLNSMSLSDALSLKQKLSIHIESLQKAEKKKAILEVRAIIENFNLDMNDVFSSTRATKARSATSKKVEPKYRDPVSGQTWTGRGKPPLWIASQDRELFLISGNNQQESQSWGISGSEQIKPESAP